MSAPVMQFENIKPPAANPPTRSLVRKLAEVMAAVERVSKRGRNEFHKYDYVTEADLADAIRSELASRQLFIFPSVKTCSRSPLEVETLKWDDSARAKVPVIRKTQLTEIEVEWTFVDGESGEERTVTVHGVGEDNVDKGFYKAFTGSEKYLLMKAFLIPTGDDPERDNREEASDARKEGKAAAKKVAERKIAEAKGEPKQDVTCIFYTKPEKHNGHFYEFINLKEYGAGLDQVAQEGLKALVKKYVSKITDLNTFLVPADKLETFLNEFNDCGIQTKQLKATD